MKPATRTIASHQSGQNLMKRSYSTPSLTYFGAVSMMTKSASGNNTNDGNSASSCIITTGNMHLCMDNQ
jgi:hypothetical protein